MSQQGPLNADQGNIDTLTGNTGGAVGPDASSNINIVGSDPITVTGNPATNTLTIETTTSLYPITPYVVGPSGQASYTTIQDAIDAATLAGGTNMIWVQPGTYTEDLNITSSITFMSVDGVAEIAGIHTPPSSGIVTFDGFLLTSATHIISSAAAGSTQFNINDSFIEVTNGYVFNVPNWTGEILMDNCGEASTNDGVINNVTGSSSVKLINVEIGAGSGQTMQLNCGGTFLRFDTCNVNCPVNMVGSGQVIVQNGVKFANTVTIGGSLTGFMINGSFKSGASPCLTFSSSGNLDISTFTFESSNNPAIDGAGAGTLTLDDVAFLDNSSIAGTLTIASGNFYAGTLKTDYTNHGILLGQGTAADVVATSALTDGQLLIGSTGTDPVLSTLTAGTNISISNAAGSITINAIGGMTWNEVTGTSDNMVVDNGYIANNVALVTLTLPSSIAVGEVVRVAGKGAGGWTIAQNAGQTINFGSSSTTTGVGGSLSSTNQFDAIELLCITADTDLVALSSIGNITVV